MIRISVCDEDKAIVFDAKEIAEKVLADCGVSGAVKGYTDSRMLMSDIYDGETIDIAVLDIEMQYYDGIQLAKEIKKKFPACYIIFLTAYEKYAVESYELQIFRYALKDAYKEKLPRYIRDAVMLLNLQSGASLTVIDGSNAERIPYKEILYIKKEGKYSVVYRTNGQKSFFRRPLSDIKASLDIGEFIVADRSCLVNITQIKCISGREIICQSGESMRVSRANLKDAKEKILRYFGSII